MISAPGMRLARSCPALLLLTLALAGCGSARDDLGPGSEVGHYKLGKPYRIAGRWYRPAYDPAYDRIGTASWYGSDFQGLPTANGEVFDRRRITAAHPTLPLPSLVRVTNLENGRSLTLRVNDRGPFVGNRMIDLSQAAARNLGFEEAGLARVRVTFLKLADATGTPPQPTVAARTPEPPPSRAVPPRVVAAAPVRLAAAPAAPPAFCSGPQFVQVGAFAEADTMRTAMATVGALRPVRVEPAFVGRQALARVRLGPFEDAAEASALLRQVQARGYPGAFLTPADGTPC